MGARAGAALAVAVVEDEVSSPEIVDEDEPENSPPNEMIRMSKDTCVDKQNTREDEHENYGCGFPQT